MAEERKDENNPKDSRQFMTQTITGRRGGGDIKFANNTYCNYEDGVAKFELEGAPDYVEGAKSEYDDSKSALQCDPAFVDPANGNFTPQGAEQLSLRTGDPRWLP